MQRPPLSPTVNHSFARVFKNCCEANGSGKKNISEMARRNGTAPLRCSRGDAPSAASPQDEQGPPQEAVLKAISGESLKSPILVAQTTNVVIGGMVIDDSTNEWLVLDKKVNLYPTVRRFTAIGTGDDEFVQSMVVAVESVIQKSIPKGRVSQEVSSRDKYVSANIGPIRVISSEQVQAVYNAMRRYDTMKYL
ncbi:unnamed protein product [Musa acuminata subsp. malaccensis]|uniref:(wild Malaysian banana) hypothetical protein n=1 Tax=Musa acuminata subsp. malaccensis TaxID=214687 RepID=A0A804JDW1_MUSAM|nr:unnamed protein product [Musa acuminata subsp. malaccensis]